MVIHITTINDFSTITIGGQILFFTGLNKVGISYIKNLKFEEGNVATKWSPAPEDTVADIANLQTQIDGKIETYSQTTDPSTSWTTTELKTQHTGDLWYNSSTKKTQRWSGTAWVNLENAEAQAASTLASKKAQVFTSTPTIPYYKGDLWITALNKTGVVKTCQTTRTSGSYTASDWVEGLKYTDDTAVNNLEIGGRNLVLSSNTEITSKNQITTYDLSEYGVANLTPGTKLTVSLEIKADVSQDIIDAYIRSSDSNVMSDEFNITTPDT